MLSHLITDKLVEDSPFHLPCSMGHRTKFPALYYRRALSLLPQITKKNAVRFMCKPRRAHQVCFIFKNSPTSSRYPQRPEAETLLQKAVSLLPQITTWAGTSTMLHLKKLIEVFSLSAKSRSRFSVSKWFSPFPSPLPTCTASASTSFWVGEIERPSVVPASTGFYSGFSVAELEAPFALPPFTGALAILPTCTQGPAT